jgi:predicted ATPase
MAMKPRVFISYSRKDGEDYATELRRELEKENIPLWQDRIGEEGGRDWWLQCMEALNKVEFMVLVMTPAAMTSPTVRREWRHARRQGVCVYPVKGVPDEQLDYSTLPRFMRDAHFYELKHDWQKFLNDLNTRCQTPRVPFVAGDLPPDFIDRPEEYEQLIAKLLDEKQENPVAITAALRGAGGYGKTTLARALCHDERIQDAFDDGILWVTLGEHPGDLTPKVIDLIEILSDERPGFSDAQAAASRLAELLADRDILLVIDDVWNSAHARPFLQGGQRCARLITTRNSDTLPPKSEQINLDAMKSQEAVRLLGFDLTGGEETPLKALAKRLGEWPQLLKLVNAALRERVERGQSLKDALTYVNKALNKRGLTAFDARDPQAREQAVSKTLDVSLELLREDERIRYNELAIFPEDTDIPLTTVQKLWQPAGLDDFDSEDLCQQFYRLSLLLQFDLTGTGAIRLHDVIRSYLQAQQKEVLAELNTRFLHAYGVEQWWELPLEEPYLWEHLAYHLQESGQSEPLRRLLLDYRWLANKLAAAGVNSLLADYDLLPDAEDLRLLQSALRLSANPLTRDPAQLPGQLLGRLQSFPTAAFEALLLQAKTLSTPPRFRPLFATLTPPGGSLMRTLEGHSGGVWSVALSGDGKRALSGSDDNTLKVWDLQSGEVIACFSGESAIWCCAIAPDGKTIVAGEASGRVHFLRLEGVS